MRPSPFRTDERGLLGPEGPIGPAFSDDLMRALISTLYQDDPDEPTNHDLSRWGGALTALEAFQPRTAVEAMLAAQAIATHNAIMESYCRAMQGALTEDLGIRLRNSAVGLTRAMDTILGALERRQAKPLPPPLPDVPVSADAILDGGPQGDPGPGGPPPDGGVPAQGTEAGSEVPEPAGTAAPETSAVDPGGVQAKAVQAGAARAGSSRASAEGRSASIIPLRPGMRPAIVIPQLEPHAPVDRSAMQRRIEDLHRQINERLDRERSGTPQEWYARQREEVRRRKEAEAAAKAAAGEDPAPPRPDTPEEPPPTD